MAIVNTRLQLRGAVTTGAGFGIPPIYLGMNPLPLKGVSNGSSIEIARVEQGGLKVTTAKVNSRSAKESSGLAMANVGPEETGNGNAAPRRTTHTVTVRRANKNGKKTQKGKAKGQKRINGRFSK